MMDAVRTPWAGPAMGQPPRLLRARGSVNGVRNTEGAAGAAAGCCGVKKLDRFVWAGLAPKLKDGVDPKLKACVPDADGVVAGGLNLKPPVLADDAGCWKSDGVVVVDPKLLFAGAMPKADVAGGACAVPKDGVVVAGAAGNKLVGCPAPAPNRPDEGGCVFREPKSPPKEGAADPAAPLADVLGAPKALLGAGDENDDVDGKREVGADDPNMVLGAAGAAAGAWKGDPNMPLDGILGAVPSPAPVPRPDPPDVPGGP